MFEKFRNQTKNILFPSAIFLAVLGVPQLLTQAADNPNTGVEQRVREYFADIPVMIEIAKCETSFRQFAANGEALKDASGTYVGIFQFDEQAHFMSAWALNLNIYTLDGNLAYARHIYNQSGARPWIGCVPKNFSALLPTQSNTQPVNAQPATPLPPQPSANNETHITVDTMANGSTQFKITRNWRMGQSGSEIKMLQQLLNAHGFQIASSGPGSPGMETNYFGLLTREALRKFQCVKINVCDGSEGTTGFGRVGPATRQALASL